MGTYVQVQDAYARDSFLPIADPQSHGGAHEGPMDFTMVPVIQPRRFSRWHLPTTRRCTRLPCNVPNSSSSGYIHCSSLSTYQSTMTDTAAVLTNFNLDTIQAKLEAIHRQLWLNEINAAEPERELPPPPTPPFNPPETDLRLLPEADAAGLIRVAVGIDPNFRPRVQYHPHQAGSKIYRARFYHPVTQPDVVDMLVGTDTTNLEELQGESGATIKLSARGTTIERNSGQVSGDDAAVCLLEADTPEKIVLCVELISNFLEMAAEAQGLSG